MTNRRLCVFCVLVLVVLCTGCVYKPGLKQGIYLNHTAVERLTIGMSREEVLFLLGPPNIVDPADQDRVFYVYTVGSVPDVHQQLVDVQSVVVPRTVLRLEFAAGRLVAQQKRAVSEATNGATSTN